jgi:hypothetical protein
MKKLVMSAALLTLLGSAAVAQTSPTPPTQPAQPLPPGFADVPDTKWGGSDLPPGLSNDGTSRTWETPPGWSNSHSQGWQNGGGPSATGGGPSSMAGAKGKGR